MKVAIISDIHANIYALEAVYADLQKEGVDKILVAGDMVGYYYWPKEVLAILMQDARVECIRGNHENILRDFVCGREGLDKYRKKYGSGYDVCMTLLSTIELDWLLALPERLEIQIGNRSFYLGHGSLNQQDEYLYPDAEQDKLIANYSSCGVTIFGHTHYPFIHVHGGRYLINPGSVGQPRDRGGLASYVIFNLENNAVRFKRRQFSIESIVAEAKKRDSELRYLWEIMSR